MLLPSLAWFHPCFSQCGSQKEGLAGLYERKKDLPALSAAEEAGLFLATHRSSGRIPWGLLEKERWLNPCPDQMASQHTPVAP